MSNGFQIEGLESLQEIARGLREVSSRKEMRRAFMKSVKAEAVKVVQEPASEAAMARLPAGGGLNARVAKQKVKVKSNTSSTSGAYIDVAAGRKGSGAAGADAGVVKHPVFGDRNVWRNTNVTPGWFSDTVQSHLSDLSPGIEKAMADVLDRLGSR